MFIPLQVDDRNPIKVNQAAAAAPKLRKNIYFKMASNYDPKNINWMDHYQRITGLIDINAFTEDLYRIEARVVPDDSRNRLVLDFIQIENSIS